MSQQASNEAAHVGGQATVWTDDGWQVERVDGAFVVTDTALGVSLPQPLSRDELRALWDVIHEALTEEHRRDAAARPAASNDPS